MSETEARKRWRTEHKDIINARRRARRVNDGGKYNRKACEYNAKNRERNREVRKKYWETHREQARQTQRKWYNNNPACRREHVWKTSGIDMRYWSYDKYIEMFKNQNGKCRGCGYKLVLSKREISEDSCVAHVDHDHTNGRVRGLLCRGCNQALGNVEDNMETLIHLVDYLKSYHLIRK